eukprot:3534674-Amphidinium_carterae.1
MCSVRSLIVLAARLSMRRQCSAWKWRQNSPKHHPSSTLYNQESENVGIGIRWNHSPGPKSAPKQ